ncbi:MAG TPA: TonB family protein [Candidatus Acidoferrum sp.]|nr:TonB family protein [Candidatus Acidoferrum sp.]
MRFSWKQYEGQVINNTFPLQQYLGGSNDSAVFLTQLAGPQSSKAAIKFILEGSSADQQLSLWRRTSKLTHPNLLRLYQGGRCRLGDMDLLYIVMEYAEEDLSQVLPQRALTAAEARDMLGPVMGALADLHAQGLVHSHLKPSNILATSDQVKLSTDAVYPVGETRKLERQRDIFDAPESATQPLTPACDSWALGATLVEVLTQHPPARQPGSLADPLVPESLPQPFLEIARHALQQDPARRWSLTAISANLNPRAAAAVAQGMAPLAVPLSPVAPVPAAKLRAPRPVPPPAPKALKVPKAPPAPVPVPQVFEAGTPKQTLVLPSYVVPLAAAIVILAAIFTLPKILGRGAGTPSPSSSTTAAAANNAPTQPVEQPASQPARQSAPKSTKSSEASAVRDNLKAAAGRTSTTRETAQTQPAAPAPAPAPASLRTQTTAVTDAPKSSATGAARGEILDQVMPEPSQSALDTIRGKVRVGIQLQVDAAGNVAQANLVNPGPSQYFADLALKAARRWEFNSPEVDGRSVASQWQVRFEFTPSGVKAFPSQTSP